MKKSLVNRILLKKGDSMTAIDRLIRIAEDEVGYLEKGSLYFLWDKTANAGRNNYTKYWAEIKPEFQGEPWCACFVTWCFTKAFGKDDTRQLLGHYPYVFVPTLVNRFEKHSNPKKGDIVCFYKNGTFAHTGIVTAVNGGYFETVEGNTSGASNIVENGGGVCAKFYTVAKVPKTVFIRPNYEEVEEMTQEERAKFNGLVNKVSDLTIKIDEIAAQSKIYHYFNELPDYARDIIEELYDKGIYKGASPADLNLPETLMRNIVITYRMLKQGGK